MNSELSFGTKVLQYRSRNGLNQSDVGKLLGVTKNTVYRWEIGQCEPSKVAVERFRVLSEQEKK